MNWLLVAAGGALGSVARYGAARLWPLGGGGSGGGWPVATLTVNLLGCFAIGLLYIWIAARPGHAEHARLFWMTGVLGGFTTWSAFALEANLLGPTASGAAYVIITVAGCIAAAWLGRWIGTALLA